MAQSLRSELKVITKHSSVYGLANALSRAVGIILIPLYTRYLTPADYGILELIGMTTSILELILGMGIQSAVSRFYFDEDNQEYRNSVISTSFVGYGSIAILATLILLPLTNISSSLVLGSGDYQNLFIIAFVTLGFGMIHPIGMTYFRVNQQSFKVMVFTVSSTILTLGLSVYFIVVLHLGVMGILLATMIARVLFTIIIVIHILLKTKINIRLDLLWKMIKFCMPLIPSNLSAYLVHMSDRYFIKEYSSLTSTGLYSIGYKIGAMINQFITSPFIQIWTPRRFEFFNRENSEKMYARIFTYYLVFSLFVGLLISVNAKNIIRVLAAEPYWEAYRVVPIIVLSYIIFSFHYHFNIGILMKKATKYMAYINISNGMLNLVLNFILIRKYDIWGAAFSTLICFFVKICLTYYFSNRIYPVIIEVKRVIILFVASFILFVIASNISHPVLILDIAIDVGICSTYPLLIYITRFFDKQEIDEMKRILKRKKLYE